MARKILTGRVVSDKATNTVVVTVERKIRHQMYQKLIKISKRFQADTNGMSVKIGDLVQIEQTKPMSKMKFFKVVKKVQEGK